jgi:hypothetical protein
MCVSSKYCFIFLLGIAFILSCSPDENLKSRRFNYISREIVTNRQAFDPLLLKIVCDSLNFKVLPKGEYIGRLIVYNGMYGTDTLQLSAKRLAAGTENGIIKADMDFDGNCEFVIPNENSTRNGGVRHYYYMYDPEIGKFKENTSLPAWISRFNLDIKNQRVKLYCPNDECFAYYKYTINKTFELVQGEFKD